MESSSKIKEAYPYEFINTDNGDPEEFKFKVSAISAYDNILALGTENGYLYSYEIKEGPDGYKFESNNQGSKRGNDKIVKLQIIPAQYNITLLVDKNFYMVSMEDLSTRQEIKTKEIKNVYNYAIKSKVDIYEVIDPFDISLALATAKGYIYLWKFNQEFKFEEDRTVSTGEIKKYLVGEKVYAMEWIENTIYIGTRNTYLIMNANTGAMQDIKVSPPFKEPQLALFNENQVILLGKGNKISSYNSMSDKNTYF
jgi:hypothetical protein